MNTQSNISPLDPGAPKLHLAANGWFGLVVLTLRGTFSFSFGFETETRQTTCSVVVLQKGPVHSNKGGIHKEDKWASIDRASMQRPQI